MKKKRYSIGLSLLLMVSLPLGALSYYLYVTVNGGAGGAALTSGEDLSIKVKIHPGPYSGMLADWWLALETDEGFYYFDMDDYAWNYGLQPTYQGPLAPVSYEVFNGNLADGNYTLYFAVDTRMNGEVDFDQLYFDAARIEMGATATPTPTTDPDATATPTPTTDPNATATPTPDPDATATPTPTATSTPDPDATATPTPTATATPDPDATATPTPTPTTEGTPTATPTPTPTPDIFPPLPS